MFVNKNYGMQNQSNLSIFFMKNLFYNVFSPVTLFSSSPMSNKPKKTQINI